MNKKPKNFKEKMGRTMNTDELAEYLGVTSGTIRNWRHKKKGPKYFKLGGYRNATVMYRWQDVKDWEDTFEFGE